jgi:hypothetical protein
MSRDDFPSCASDGINESFGPFEGIFFDDQDTGAESLFGDVTEATTTFCPFTLTTATSPLFSIQNHSESPSPLPASSSDSEWDWISKVVTLKRGAGESRNPIPQRRSQGQVPLQRRVLLWTVAQNRRETTFCKTGV